MKSQDGSDNNNAINRLPDELHPLVTKAIGTGRIWATAGFDLDDHGLYVEAYLVLADGELLRYVAHDGGWRADRFNVADYTAAAIVEGLGMSLLRLLTNGKMALEFRFTMRHAKAMAQLQRQLARQIDGKQGAAAPVVEHKRPDEKKIRCEKCGRVIPAWSETCPACTSRRKILSRLLDYVKPYKLRIVAGITLAILILLLQLAQPWLTKPMVDKGLGQSKWSLFLALWVVWAGLILISLVVQGLQNRVMAVLGACVSRDLRNTVYRHIHRLSLSFFSRKRTGSLVTRTTSDTDRLQDFVAFTVVEVVMAILTITGVSVVMFCMHWKLALVTLAPVPVMFGLMVFFHKRLHNVFRRIWHRWSQMTSVVAGALPGVRVIKAFGQESREVDRFHQKSSQVFDEQMSMINLWTTFGPVMRFCASIGTLMIWLAGGYWVVQSHNYTQLHPGQSMPGAMTLGTLMAFMMYMQMFYRPIHMIAQMDRRFNRAATSAQRIFEILDTEPAIFSRGGAQQPDKIAGEIELRDVSFSYDGVRKVLKNINMKIGAGEMVGLAGPSGGGKTTMINLICRFYDVMEGAILIDGIDVRDYQLHALRRKIGVVLQEPFLFYGTVAENIAYGNPGTTLDQIIESAKAANAHDFITGFPDGYDTMVGERGHSLSGGERQRISIARAILDNPSVLILDEATSSVDTETEQLIQEALNRLIANRTTIAIAHRLSTLHKADRLIILDKGELVEQGTHKELLTHKDGLYARLVRMQAEMQAVMTT